MIVTIGGTKLKLNIPIILAGVILVLAIEPAANWVTVARLSRNLAAAQSIGEESTALTSINMYQDGYRVRFFNDSGAEIWLNSKEGNEPNIIDNIAEIEITFKTGKVVRRKLLLPGNVGGL